MRIEHVYVCASPRDLRYTRCCVASIRRWYPDLPVTLLKDESTGSYSTRELERAWNVELFAGGRALPGRGWAKLEPLFLPLGQRCLIVDSDVVFAGPVLDALAETDADLIVDSAGARTDSILDVEELKLVDPEFEFPGYTFNTGALVASTGVLTRADFAPLVRFGAVPLRLRNDVFGNHENEGVLNYVLLRKAQRGELTLARAPLMRSGKAPLDAASGPALVHWHGRKYKLFALMRNGRLLRRSEARYYSRVRHGQALRRWRSMRTAWRILTQRELLSVTWNYPRPQPQAQPARPVRPIERIYICASPLDLRYTRCCVASIRNWYPEIPITLMKDETRGPYDTRELEAAWDVDVWRGDRPLPGNGWSKLEPLFLQGQEHCLIIDSDIVFLGRVLDPLVALDADFVVESWGGRPPDWYGGGYFDLGGLRRLDPEFAFPGYTFNAGNLVATTGLLRRQDFEGLVRFGREPRVLREDVFESGDQGVLNYVLLKKAQLGELTVERSPLMEWGFSKRRRGDPERIRTRLLSADSPYSYLMHWSTRKRRFFLLMRNGRILRHFERSYYSRVRSGRVKRMSRLLLMTWRILTGRERHWVAHLQAGGTRHPGR